MSSKVPHSYDLNKDPKFHFEIGPIRPPSEGNDRSLLLRVNRNCPWNRCLFCNTYRGRRFEYRSVEEVLSDIDVVKNVVELLKKDSWEMGYGGRIGQQVVQRAIDRHQNIYGHGAADEAELAARFGSLANVVGWLSSGSNTVFLQDANAIIMRPPELMRVLSYLKSTFPTIERVTSYGRAKTAAQRTLDELQALREAGLTRLHVGLESGCEEVLTYMKKGTTAEEQIRAGKKIKGAGITLSEYVMPGLGGSRLSNRHSRDTAEALNEIGPDFIRLRSLIVRANSRLAEMEAAGGFQPLDEDGVVDEIGRLVAGLECSSYLVSDQMSNLLWEVQGQLPEEKAVILGEISRYQRMPLRERLRFRLQRRTQSYLAVYGEIPEGLVSRLAMATRALDDEVSNPAPPVEAAIAQLKLGFV